MKTATLLVTLTIASGWAQVGPPPSPRPVVSEAAKPASSGTIPKAAPKTALSRQSLKSVEDDFNAKLASFNPGDPVYMLGATRGIYLQGYGAVFSAELDLVQSPTINPFQKTISPEQAKTIHDRKVKQL